MQFQNSADPATLLQTSLNQLFWMFDGIASIKVHTDDAGTQYCISNINFSFFSSISSFAVSPPALKPPTNPSQAAKLAQAQQADLEKRVRAIKREAAKRGVPLLWWAPVQHNSLLLALRRSGFEYADTLMGMHAKVHNLLEQNAALALPVGCEFEQVASPEAEAAWSQVVATTFDLPLFYGELFLKASKCFIHNGREPTTQVYALNFLLKKEGKPVGAASVFFGQGVVDFYNVAILPECQGNGLGRHLMLGCLQAIAQRGRESVVLNSTAAGQPLYQSLGFEPVCELMRLQWYPK